MMIFLLQCLAQPGEIYPDVSRCALTLWRTGSCYAESTRGAGSRCFHLLPKREGRGATDSPRNLIITYILCIYIYSIYIYNIHMLYNLTIIWHHLRVSTVWVYGLRGAKRDIRSDLSGEDFSEWWRDSGNGDANIFQDTVQFCMSKGSLHLINSLISSRPPSRWENGTCATAGMWGMARWHGMSWMIPAAGWWFWTWLLWLPFHTWDVILPIDERLSSFSEGWRKTTNQHLYWYLWELVIGISGLVLGANFPLVGRVRKWSWTSDNVRQLQSIELCGFIRCVKKCHDFATSQEGLLPWWLLHLSPCLAWRLQRTSGKMMPQLTELMGRHISSYISTVSRKLLSEQASDCISSCRSHWPQHSCPGFVRHLNETAALPRVFKNMGLFCQVLKILLIVRLDIVSFSSST